MTGPSWWVYIHRSNNVDLKQGIKWSLVGRIFRYARPYRTRIALLFFTILITTALGLVTPLILRDLIDTTLPNKDLTRLLWLSAALIALPIVNGLVTVYQRMLNSSIGEGVIYDLRVGLFAHLQRMSLRFFTNTKTGEIISRLNNDVIGAQNAISSTIVNIVINVIQIIATLAVMITLEWRLTLICVLVLPFFIITAQRLGGRLRELERERMKHNAQMNAMMNETLNIGGALLVKLFGQADAEVNRFEDRAVRVRDIGIQRAVLGRWFFMIIGLVSAIGTALTFGVGGYLVIIDLLSVGSIVALSAYLGQLYASLQALTTAPVEFATSMVSFERVFEVTDLDFDVDEKPDAKTLNDVEGRIVFDDVTFRYDMGDANLLSDVERHGRADSVAASLTGQAQNSNKNGKRSQARDEALKNISFEIENGQLVALVGPSGAGKTTLTYLIPRLYDPSIGSISLDGNDLRDISLTSLAQNIGMVTQETHLFHDSIRTNFLYARPDMMTDYLAAKAVIDDHDDGKPVDVSALESAKQAIANIDEEISEAAKAANIYDFIMELPNQFDTVVGERGYRLSGGEKQRVALARVILKDPRILVLDEATSHLDSQSEALIQEALGRVMEGRTSIVIAHRLSTILSADQIFVMDRGKIVERGTHAALMAQDGLYAELYHTQFKDRAEPAPETS